MFLSLVGGGPGSDVGHIVAAVRGRTAPTP